MIKITRSFFWISFAVIVVVVFGFIFMAIRMANNSNLDTIMAVMATPSGSSDQTYRADKLPLADADDLIVGEASAPIKIFVYEDYASPYSADLARNLERLDEEYPGRLAFIFRPLIDKSEMISILSAQAIDCAGDKKMTMRSQVFDLSRNDQLSDSSLSTVASSIGLNETDFSQCLFDLPNLEKYERISAEAKNYSVLGAPTFFINDKMIVGSRPYEDYTDSNGDRISGLKSLLEIVK